MSKASAKLLLVLPAIIINVIVDVFISSVVSHTVFYQLLFYGVERHSALIISVIVAVAVYAYVVFSHRLRDLIKDNGVLKNE